jgi:hypothetical protein
VIWGALLLLGGLGVWWSLPRGSEDVPDAWKESRGPRAGAETLVAETRRPDPAAGQLLRLEWPAHPRAEGYIVRFQDEKGLGPAPVPVQGTVFLYDLQSNVLHLPEVFEWEVLARLPDGSHVVTPLQRYPPGE